MNYIFKITKISCFTIVLCCFFSSCDSETTETVNTTRKVLHNGKHIIVEKTNKETTSIGIFTKHNYGTTHKYSYKVMVDPGSIVWEESGEPKSVLFCKDTTYIRFLKKLSVETSYTDSAGSVAKYKRHDEIQELYQKHVDERYFFKLFGTDYWENISLEHFSILKNSCNPHEIPNDGELSIKPLESL